MKWEIGKLYGIICIIIILPFLSYAQESNKKTLKYHSDIFKDTSNLCSGARYTAYQYIINCKRINHSKSKWIEKYLGINYKSADKGNTTYMYAIKCTCSESNEIDWPLCLYVVFVVSDKKVIKTYFKEFN